jgi:uncharacterized membrane protein YeaQ/YmgE (transglycosylase-associated protein family)
MGCIHFIGYIIAGFIIGLCGRALLPGAQHLGFIATTVLGVVGSLVGGLIGGLISKPKEGSRFHPAGFILSVIGAIIALYAYIRLG